MADRPGGLGRIHRRDLRDLSHLMRAARPQAFADPPASLPKTKHYDRGPIMDQGQTGTCVGFSLVAKLAGAPVRVSPGRCIRPFDLYDHAIVIDEIADNDHDVERQMGTTIRAGCKVLQAMDLISAYHWAYTVDDILRWILSGQGGLVLGIDWYDWMNEPSAEGIIRRQAGARAHLLGGHAIYCFGADRTRGLLALQNSWGPDWGGWLGYRIGKPGPKTPDRRERINAGCCLLPLEELEKLLKGNGEAVAIVEKPWRAPKVAPVVTPEAA